MIVRVPPEPRPCPPGPAIRSPLDWQFRATEMPPTPTSQSTGSTALALRPVEILPRYLLQEELITLLRLLLEAQLHLLQFLLTMLRQP